MVYIAIYYTIYCICLRHCAQLSLSKNMRIFSPIQPRYPRSGHYSPRSSFSLAFRQYPKRTPLLVLSVGTHIRFPLRSMPLALSLSRPSILRISSRAFFCSSRVISPSVIFPSPLKNNYCHCHRGRDCQPADDS